MKKHATFKGKYVISGFPQAVQKHELGVVGK